MLDSFPFFETESQNPSPLRFVFFTLLAHLPPSFPPSLPISQLPLLAPPAPPRGTPAIFFLWNNHIFAPFLNFHLWIVIKIPSSLRATGSWCIGWNGWKKVTSAPNYIPPLSLLVSLCLFFYNMAEWYWTISQAGNMLCVCTCVSVSMPVWPTEKVKAKTGWRLWGGKFKSILQHLMHRCDLFKIPKRFIHVHAHVWTVGPRRPN